MELVSTSLIMVFKRSIENNSCLLPLASYPSTKVPPSQTHTNTAHANKKIRQFENQLLIYYRTGRFSENISGSIFINIYQHVWAKFQDCWKYLTTFQWHNNNGLYGEQCNFRRRHRHSVPSAFGRPPKLERLRASGVQLRPEKIGHEMLHMMICKRREERRAK